MLNLKELPSLSRVNSVSKEHLLVWLPYAFML